MDDTCPNPYGCEWNIAHLWHAMNWLGRLDVVVLAILLTYGFFISVRASRANRVAQHAANNGRASARFNVELNMRLRTLRSIAFISPYLGLVGACIGIMSAFTGIGMEKHAALAMIASTVAASLVTTGAGIIVAVAAICLFHYLGTFSDLLREEIPVERLPLKRRFSAFPAFALIAAPTLGLSIAAFLAFSSFHPPTGLRAGIAPARCEFDTDDRAIVLRITDDGRVFINQEQEDWNNLAGRLSEIYRLRAHRTLYLSAEDAVPFQSVADAISIATNAVGTENSLHITVQLVTPAALNAECPEPRRYRSRM